MQSGHTLFCGLGRIAVLDDKLISNDCICRPEDLRIPFERYGVIKDVYLPKDYYTG
jgi:hypothetical protein